MKHLTTKQLDELERHARDAAPGVCTLEAAELLELVTAYRESKIVSGDAFVGAMLGGFAGARLDRFLGDLAKPKRSQSAEPKAAPKLLPKRRAKR